MKNLFPLTFFNKFAFFYVPLLISSCQLTHEKALEPQDKASAQNGSARKGGITVNSIPPGGCPDGYTWDNLQGKCVRESITTTYPDINPNTITFYEDQSVMKPVQNSNASVRVTPGSVINGKQYFRHHIYVNGSPTNEKIIANIKSTSTGYQYTDYYDIMGKHIGAITVYNGNQFHSWKPSYTGTPDGSGFAARGFIGGMAKCIGNIVTQMGSGSTIGALAFLGCTVWGGYCAAAVGIACSVQVAGGVYN